MRYLAKIVGLPNASTGEIKVIVPSLSGDEQRKANPLKPFLGLYEPYKLGDIVVVEMIEGVMYYGDKPYAIGEYSVGAPKNAYSFITPYGYIAFTPDNVIIKHIKGGELSLSTQKLTPDTVTVGTETSSESFMKIVTGSAISPPVKWR